MESAIHDVDAATTAEVAVVTVPSLDGESVEEYANTLFNRWGIGKAGWNNGILLLVAPNERRARIEVGYGLEPLFPDGLCGELLDEHAVPSFRNGAYGEGIEAAVAAILERLRANPVEARGVESSAPKFLRGRGHLVTGASIAAIVASSLQLLLGWWRRRRESYPTGLFLVGLLATGGTTLAAAGLGIFMRSEPGVSWFWLGGGGMAAAWALFSNIRGFLRFGPHFCRTCGATLQLLSETDDDARLSVEERLEEELGSVDYDLWICPRCLKFEKKNYVAWFSGFTNCPRCSRRTLKETETVLVAATTVSSGRKRIDGHCASCKHQTTRYEVIPRISTSSGGGSSGGGFGGGSSGGGGASRSW